MRKSTTDHGEHGESRIGKYAGRVSDKHRVHRPCQVFFVFFRRVVGVMRSNRLTQVKQTSIGHGPICSGSNEPVESVLTLFFSFSVFSVDFSICSSFTELKAAE